MANRFKPAPSGPWALFLRLVRSLCWDQAPRLFFRATLWDTCHSWTSMQSLSIEHGQEVASKTTEMLETDETDFMNEYFHEEWRTSFINKPIHEPQWLCIINIIRMHALANQFWRTDPCCTELPWKTWAFCYAEALKKAVASPSLLHNLKMQEGAQHNNACTKKRDETEHVAHNSAFRTEPFLSNS